MHWLKHQTEEIKTKPGWHEWIALYSNAFIQWSKSVIIDTRLTNNWMTNYYLQYALVIPSQRWAGSFSQFLFAMECFFFSYSSSSSLWVNRLNHSSLEYTPCTIRSLSWCTIRVLVFWLSEQRTSLKIVTKTSIFGIDEWDKKSYRSIDRKFSVFYDYQVNVTTATFRNVCKCKW